MSDSTGAELVLPETRVCGEPAEVCVSHPEATGEMAYLCSWCYDLDPKYFDWEEIRTNLSGKTCQGQVRD